MAIFGDENHHTRVRTEIYMFMMKKYQYWKSKFPAIRRMRFGKYRCLSIFEAASQLYKRPIIIFSSTNESPFLEKIFKGGSTNPIYLVTESDYNYSYLMHKS
jgi:hypothetical protein